MARIHLYCGEYARDVMPYCANGRFGMGLVGIHHTTPDPRRVTCVLCQGRWAGEMYRAIHGAPDKDKDTAKPGPDGDPRPLGDDAA